MKRLKWSLWAILLVSLLIPHPVNAASLAEDQVVLGGSFTLRSGQTLDGNLIVIGGTARVEENAVVNGSIVLVGGQVTVDGTIEESIHLFAGSANLTDTAVVQGDVYLVSSVLNKTDKTEIHGEVKEGGSLPSGFVIPEKPSAVTPIKPVVPSENGLVKKVTDFLGSLLSIFFFSISSACVAMLVALFVPKHINRVSNAIITAPWIGFLVAVLTLIAFPIIVVILAISIILAPVAVLAVVGLALACYLGWVALGTELGDRIARLFKTTWAVPVSAGMGTLILGLVLGVITLIPCVGWLVVSIIILIGLGGVILTRIGTRIYDGTSNTTAQGTSLNSAA